MLQTDRRYTRKIVVKLTKEICNNMVVKQFFDETLAHSSYAIASAGKVALVDPARDTAPYEAFARDNDGEIVAVFETHPHADFISSHREFQEKLGAKVYIHPKAGVAYDYSPLEHGEEVKIGGVTFRALFTPGHSPDHNSYLLLDENGVEKAVFTGDSLFIGDVGRPDLREGVGNIQASRHDLASMMYETITNIFTKLPDDVVVYPAHGAGSLCGKNLSDDLESTIGREKETNWAFQFDDEQKFIESYLEGQSFIPKYFPYDVDLNRKGAGALDTALAGVPRLHGKADIKEGIQIIDVRPSAQFKAGHYAGAINIQAGEKEKFETWLGAIVAPNESYYLVAENETQLTEVIFRAAKIGYEAQLAGGLVYDGAGDEKSETIDLAEFKANPDEYTIVDIRNTSEVKGNEIFDGAINLPLHELRQRSGEVPAGKPVVVHCAGGYRSAAGSSILENALQVPVYDLSEAVKEFQEVSA